MQYPRTIVALLVAVAASPSLAAADAGYRQHNTSARLLGCSRYAQISCDGVTTSRAGLTLVDLSWSLDDRWSLVGMFQASARPDVDALLDSQVITGAGVRFILSRFWIQGGVGIGAIRHAPGPKSMTAVELLSDASPAVLGGVGVSIDETSAFSIDASAAFDEPTHVRLSQLTAGLTRQF